MDRSLTADQPATAPHAATRAITIVDTGEATPSTKTPAATEAQVDLSGLTREQLEERVRSLTDSLAAANKESEDFRQQWADLKLRDQALGVEALTVDESKLEEKDVQATAEVYQSEMRRREALVLLDKLLSTTDTMIQTAPNYDPKVRAEYEIASRGARAYLGGHSGAAIPLATSLADGRIADLNPEINAVILNMGKSQGVREGMPIGIFRDNVEVATVKVVLARDLVSAAQIENVMPKIVLKVGDRATVLAQQ